MRSGYVAFKNRDLNENERTSLIIGKVGKKGVVGLKKITKLLS